MAYSDIYQAGTGRGIFYSQVVMSMIVAAATIREENPSTQHHAERLAWANQAGEQRGAENMANKWIWRILESQMLRNELDGGGNASDGQVQQVVNDLIPVMAGYA